MMNAQLQEMMMVTANGNINKLSRDGSFWSEGPRSSFLISGEDTHGQAALIEAVHRQGQEPPAHVHPVTDEIFYVMEGEMTFYVDGESISAPAGTTVFIGRGKEHSFQVETTTANTLTLLIPAVTQLNLL
jgi:quercetin dioxygenase-like cupin family protein